MVRHWRAIGALIVIGIALGCTPKSGTPTTPKPSPSPSFLSHFGPNPAVELASLPVQPKSGTWEITGKLASDKIVPVKVVLEFQPNGLIAVDGDLKTDQQAVTDPYNRDYVSRPSTLGQVKTTVIFQLRGQYTLTLLNAETMDGVALVGGSKLAAVRLTWISAETTLPS
jgi:uncharacterized protein (DUF58 family)